MSHDHQHHGRPSATGMLWLALTSAAALRLAVEGRLSWYVHPRNVAFCIAMAALGALLVAGHVVMVRPWRGDAHQDDRRLEGAGHDSGGRRPIARTLRVVLPVAVLVVLLVVPARPLTGFMAQQRAAGTASGTSNRPAVEQQEPLHRVLSGAPGREPSLRDWASALEHGSSAMVGRTAVIEGFVVPDDDPEVIQITRLVVTCCIADAMPVMVRVKRPEWRSLVKPNQWIHVEGHFVSENSTVLLQADSARVIPVPEQPYVS